MIYIDNQWFQGTNRVNYAELIIRSDTCDILTHLINWPDTNNLGITIDVIDEDNYKITGLINNVLYFIYTYILNYKNYTIYDILKDPDLQLNIEIYLQKVW